MGLFDFVGNIASATIKTALTPVAVVVDTVKVFGGEDPDTTIDLLGSIVEDVEDGFDELID